MAGTGPFTALAPIREDGTVNVVVETPAGGRCKLKYEAEMGAFTVSKILPEGFVFPFDFGFVPGTLAEDGDPLDVMLIAEAGTVPGCVVPARLLGALEAEQTDSHGQVIRNDRILAVPLASRLYAELTALDQMPPPLRQQIEHFLTSYGVLDGKKLKITHLRGPAAAMKRLRGALQSRP